MNDCELDWRSEIDFDMEKDCPLNKQVYDNDCYDCDWYCACLYQIEKLD